MGNGASLARRADLKGYAEKKKRRARFSIIEAGPFERQGREMREISRMKRSIFLAIASFTFAGPLSAQMDVFIFAGQSNMVGQAPLAGEPSPVSGVNLQMLCPIGSGWQEAHDPTSPYPSAKASPVLWAGDKLCCLCGHQVGVINVAVGGTWLREWAPNYATHSYYSLIMQAYRAGCQAGTVKGFFWYQGESDADNSDDVHAYGPQMYWLLNAVHRDLGNVPVVFVQLGPNPNQSYLPYWTSIQEVQGWIAEGAPSWLSMVTASDLSAEGSNDPHHLNQASVITLGGRMGQAMYNLLYGGQ